MGERRVTIIILTWNGLDFTRRCLATLRAFTDFAPYEVVVVDNGSTDGTLEFLASVPWVRVIANGVNLGFVRGNNIGIALSDPTSDCVLLNNDTEIYQRDWLDRLQATAYGDPQIGVVGCRQVRPGNRLLHVGAYMPVETFWGQQIGGLEKDINQYGATRAVDSVAFGCVYLKRAVLDDVGGLDEDYFSYFEDTDYCLRARAKGYATVCCGEVTIVHHENVSSRVNDVKFADIFKPSQRIFRRKWEETLKNAYSHRVVWHSTVSRPMGYAQLSREVLGALDDRKLYVAYRYVYGPGTPFPPEEPDQLDDYRFAVMRQRPAPASYPQVVLGQGDVFERNFGRYKIGCTMLEVDGLPREWVRQANLMDEVWVPAPFNEQTFRDSGVTRPIHVIPFGINPHYFNPSIRGYPVGERFTFLANFEWGERKNPEMLLRAFNDEFSADDDAVLLVKTVNSDPGVDVAAQVRDLGLRPGGGRIEFMVNRFLPAYQLGSLYRSVDCFVSTTRGEGWGMPILEAMACGLPVIATDWSAQRLFMTEANAYPLRVKRLIPAVAKCPYYDGFRWADPDEEHLRHLLRWVYEHRDEAEATGRRASADALSRWTWPQTAAKVCARVEEIAASQTSPPRVTSRRAGERPLVGIDVSRALGEPTGVGVYALNLVKGLALVDAENPYVLYPGFGPFVHPDYPARVDLQAILPPNFRVYAGDLPAFGDHEQPGADRFEKRRAAIVHSTGNTAPDVGAAQLIMTVYDVTFRTLGQFHTAENIALCEQGIRDAVRHDALFCAISESTRRDLARECGIADERIEVVLPGIDPRFAPVRDAEALERVMRARGLDRPYVLFVGSNEPRKNLNLLLEVHHALRSQRGAGHLLAIAGAAGWLNGETFALVRRLGLEDSVRFLGYVPDEDLPALYTGCQAFVYPSLYEGFGLPVAEAMACGAPVITSNVSSLPEVAGDAAILVDPRDVHALVRALREVLESATLRRSLRARSLARAPLFSLERMGAAMLGVYERVRERVSARRAGAA